MPEINGTDRFIQIKEKNLKINMVSLLVYLIEGMISMGTSQNTLPFPL